MSLERIRSLYGVPAKRGARVVYFGDGKLARGVVTGSAHMYIRVRLDGERRSGRYHPTWMLDYEDAPSLAVYIPAKDDPANVANRTASEGT